MRLFLFFMIIGMSSMAIAKFEIDYKTELFVAAENIMKGIKVSESRVFLNENSKPETYGGSAMSFKDNIFMVSYHLPKSPHFKKGFKKIIDELSKFNNSSEMDQMLNTMKMQVLGNPDTYESSDFLEKLRIINRDIGDTAYFSEGSPVCIDVQAIQHAHMMRGFNSSSSRWEKVGRPNLVSHIKNTITSKEQLKTECSARPMGGIGGYIPPAITKPISEILADLGYNVQELLPHLASSSESVDSTDSINIISAVNTLRDDKTIEREIPGLDGLFEIKINFKKDCDETHLSQTVNQLLDTSAIKKIDFNSTQSMNHYVAGIKDKCNIVIDVKPSCGPNSITPSPVQDLKDVVSGI